MHDVLYWSFEVPFDRDKLRRLVAWRQMSGGGRGRRHFGPGGPGGPGGGGGGGGFGRGPWVGPLFGGMPRGPEVGRRRRASRGGGRPPPPPLLQGGARNGHQVMPEPGER